MALFYTTMFIMFFGSAIAEFMADQIGTLVLAATAATLYMLADVLYSTAFGDSIRIEPAQAEAQ